jgi:hypothetical protein
MTINQGPNSQIDVDQFSTGVRNVLNTIENPSISNLVGTPGQKLLQRSNLLSSMVSDINRPILRGLANDMISVMASWLDDPQVLCCLIQGIWSAYVARNTNLNVRSSITLADSDFGKFLDHMIAFLDFIIILLTQDIKRMVFFIPDFIKEIMNVIIGAVLLLIQETAFALRDSILSVVFEWISVWDTEKTWSKCLPLKQMMNILKKYIHDYGLLADIFEKIKGYVSGIRSKSERIADTLVPNVKDLEFLYWLRDLFIKLKRATLNFDLCVDYEFIPNKEITKPNDDQSIKKNIYVDDTTLDNKVNPNKQQGYTIGSDGTILIDRDKVVNGNYIPRLSNSFLREFIHKEYNIPYDVIDNTITRGTSGDHIQGTIVTSDATNTIIDRCSNTPTAEETVQWILNLRNRLS